MPFLLLSGLVFTIVPTALILGFALFTFFAFVRDDDDAKAILNVALLVAAIGVAMLIAYFAGVTVG